MSTTDYKQYEKLGPFEIKDFLAKVASKSALENSLSYLNAGRGNPNWVATEPREGFFLLGQFAITECKRVMDLPPGVAGMPKAAGCAARLEAWLEKHGDMPGADFLKAMVPWAVKKFDFEPDKFVHELVDSIIGDHYPVPDRMLVHNEQIVHEYLEWAMCGSPHPKGKFKIYAVEGGTAAMCYIFKSLKANRIINQGDTIALGTPIFTPYLEMAHLEDYDLHFVEIKAPQENKFQYTDEELKKLLDPKIKAFFIVNPGNPYAVALSPETIKKIGAILKKRPDLILLTDDVYGTFVPGFRSLMGEYPKNTIGVYSYSKYFGCTGWRLGTIALHEDNIIDELIAKHPDAIAKKLDKRYGGLTLEPRKLAFIDRIVADSRDVALNHTAGLSLPQQVMMSLFSLYELMDTKKDYQKACIGICKKRVNATIEGLDIPVGENPLFDYYYGLIDFEFFARKFLGEDIVTWMKANVHPLDIVFRLAEDHGIVLLNGSGFAAPDWSVRISFANLDDHVYDDIGRALRAVARGYRQAYEAATGKSVQPIGGKLAAAKKSAHELEQNMNAESKRLSEARDNHVPWRAWGPYLSERQWGTVREDYSLDGDAWGHFSHDQAHSRAYRWGEDGIGGICDDGQRLCFALALWNGKDAILKERLFGLTNAQGNHGEDVKEYYFYLDSTPTHSYMKFLYKYPQQEFPYEDIVRTNRERSRHALEYELLDTGVFKHGYWDVVVEYAKNKPDDILIEISVTNRGNQRARVSVLPTLWFRNTWSWGQQKTTERKPMLRQLPSQGNQAAIVSATHAELGEWHLYCADNPAVLFTENETNQVRCFQRPNTSEYRKDGINNFVTRGEVDAVNPAKVGTKAAAHYQLEAEPGETKVVHLRLAAGEPIRAPFATEYQQIFAARELEADEFYSGVTPPSLTEDAAAVMRQAFAGMMWSKQYYHYDISRWLEEHFPGAAASSKPVRCRNSEWSHMVNADVISMPDKWEYPWYAAWDLAFHCVPIAAIDPDFAKQQLRLMLKEHYLHPTGQIPAYEWNFGDVNPPVHAWAVLFVYNIDKQNRGDGDLDFLKSAFQKLLLNFTWWVNRKDRTGRNVFEGGFLGLDNIGVFDRSSPLPTGGYLEQADGTAWMAFFSQSMLEIALELAHYDHMYDDFVLKFAEHFLKIGSAMDRIGEHADEMWDEDDGFFYDVLRFPDGTATRLKVRSVVGLLSLCATTVLTPESARDVPQIVDRLRWLLDRDPHLAETIHNPREPGVGGRRLLSLLDENKLRRVLAIMLDENEFLSPYGIRSLSRRHAAEPFVYHHDNQTYSVEYAPAESTSGLFGGNSNWRGPIWMPINLLLLRALLKLYGYYGDTFKIECPTGSGKMMTLYEVSAEISRRLTAIFCQNPQGRRPVYGEAGVFQDDPNWRDNVLFYEYFHGDNGAGIGASHQTGWTGAIATVIQMFGAMKPADVLKDEVVVRVFRNSRTPQPRKAGV